MNKCMTEIQVQVGFEPRTPEQEANIIPNELKKILSNDILKLLIPYNGSLEKCHTSTSSALIRVSIAMAICTKSQQLFLSC